MFILKEYYLNRDNDIVESKEVLKTEDINEIEKFKEEIVLECKEKNIEVYEIMATRNIQSLREILKRNVRIFKLHTI